MITISQMLLTLLLNAFWQLVLITTVAVLCARLLGNLSARFKYLLWVAALSLAVFLPVLTSSAPLREVLFVRAPPAIVERQPEPREIEASPINSSNIAKPETASLTVPLALNLALGLLAIYFIFVLYRGAKLFRAWRRTRAIVRGAREIPLSPDLERAVEKCRAAIEVKKVSVLCSDAVAVPMTAGNREPVIILPARMFAETDENLLTTAVGHELAHIQRRDYIFNLIFELVYLPLSFHPAATLLKRRINQTRELCCDEMVAKRLLKADVYARSLVKIAGSAANLGRPAPTVTVGITDTENLEVRIMSLLKKSESNLYRKTLLMIAAGALLAVPCVVAAFFGLNLGISSVSAQQTETPESLQEHREREEKIVKERKEKLEREMKELQVIQPDGSDLSEPGSDLAARKRMLEKQVMEFRNSPEDVERRREKEEKIAAERAEQSKLAKETKITMEQAIQLATNTQPGVVFSSHLGRANGEVVYRVFVLDKDGAEGSGTLVVVSGLDGRVIKTEKGFL